MGCALNIGRMLSGQLFPGQYYDSESGFNQNHYRDYDPSLGAYIQPDPRGQLLDFSDPDRQVAAQLGIAIPPKRRGYLNHNYVYVDGSPVIKVDKTGEGAGLNTCVVVFIFAVGYSYYCEEEPDSGFCPATPEDQSDPDHPTGPGSGDPETDPTHPDYRPKGANGGANSQSTVDAMQGGNGD